MTALNVVLHMDRMQKLRYRQHNPSHMATPVICSHDAVYAYVGGNRYHDTAHLNDATGPHTPIAVHVTDDVLCDTLWFTAA